jgi:D-inositol-3-phosphate glycosyltransferase
VFRDVDVLVHPTPNEGFGRVVAEAQVRGVPAVVAWEGGAREIVEEGTTGYSIRGGDEEAFASAVARLVADRELRARLGAAARARARGMFGHDAFGERLRSLYDEALDGLT